MVFPFWSHSASCAYGETKMDFGSRRTLVMAERVANLERIDEGLANLERLGTPDARARAALATIAEIAEAGIVSGHPRGAVYNAQAFIVAYRVIEQCIEERRSHVSPEPRRRSEASRSRSPPRRIHERPVG